MEINNDFLQNLMEQAKVRLCRYGVEKRSYYVRFRNRNAIKWYIPISFFFALKKRSEMLVNKRVGGFEKLYENIEVRYQVPKKIGFRGV